MALLDTAKDVYDLAKKGLNIELQEKVMSLREEALALQEENHQLRKRILQLEGEASQKANVTFHEGNGLYYVGSAGPFCQICYDRDGKLCRVVDMSGNRNSEFRRVCKVCDEGYR